MRKYNKILLLILIVSILFFVGCRKKDKKVVSVKSTGSLAVVTTLDNAPYEIKELGIKSKDNILNLGDFVISEDFGKFYAITDCKGEKIAQVRLINKRNLLPEKSLVIDLKDYSYKAVIVEKDISDLYINGYENMPQKELFIWVKQRLDLLDIHLNNVNLYTSDMVPIIYNEGDNDININCTGNNFFTTGNDLPNKKETEALISEEEMETIIDLTVPLYLMLKNAKSGTIKAIGAGLFKGKDGFIESYAASMEKSHELVKEWGSAFLGFLAGNKGVNGIPGSPAIQSPGGVGIYGSGNITIIGGDGIDGGDAKGIGLTDTPGGKGGDGAPAIYSYIFINVADGKTILKSGNPGEGGLGFDVGGDSHRVRASSGNKSDPVNAFYSYSK